MTTSIPSVAERTIVIVLGMHRSGTSVLTRGLATLGIELGTRMLPAAEENPRGFWENRAAFETNEAFLSELGSSWDGLGLIDWDRLPAALKQDFRFRARRVILQEFDNAPLFGFKDPRTARLLPIWQDACSTLGLNDRYVILLRNPISVAHSLEARNGFPHEKSHLLWLLHMVPALMLTRDKPRCIVEYDRFIASPAETLRKISESLALRTDEGALRAATEFEREFVSEGLRHSSFDWRAVAEDRAVPHDANVLYRALCRVCAGDASLDDDPLDSTLSRIEESLQLFAPVLHLTERFDLAAKRARVELLASQSDSTERSQTNEQFIAELEMRVNALSADLDDTSHRNRALDLELELARREISMLREERQHLVAMRDRVDVDLRTLQAERDSLRTAFQAATNVASKEVAALRQSLSEVLNSTSWKVSAPVRFIGRQMARMRTADSTTRAPSTGPNSPQASNRDTAEDHPDPNDYIEWVRRYDTITDSDRAKIRDRIDRLREKPLISLVMPVFNPPLSMLNEAIESVVNQLYPNWELCIADDASTDKSIRSALKRWAQQDPRIKIVFRDVNGHISAASNSALDVANGAFIAFLDNDDLLSEHALFWIAQAIADHPEVALIYSDEDKIDESGSRSEPYFKSDWNADLFLSHNMICHLSAYRADLIRDVGGFREGYEGAQDYDLALRCIEKLEPRQIVHIPKVLYHWRSHAGSTAQGVNEKPYALVAGERALNDHFARIGTAARAEVLDIGMYRTRYEVLEPAPLVSLIIPTRNSLQLIGQCVASILDRTTYQHYEIIVVDNGSDDPRVLEYFETLDTDDRVRVLRDDRPFNFSALNNFAAEHARGEYLGLLNDDVEVRSPHWLEEMVSLAQQPGVGAVGARLWYPDDTLQHGGVILGIGGIAGHSHKRLPEGQPGYFGRAQLIQCFSAVTAACLIVRKSLYEDVGGLDESNLKIAFNDVDFCLRLSEAGYRNVWTPYAELYHHESATRGHEDTPDKQRRFESEANYMRHRWGEALLNDPAYNPNLTLDHEDFSFAWPPRMGRAG